jgi:CheY-like chemotaxis protein
VLVVDDDPDTLVISTAALEHAGYEVHVAADGLAALAAIRHKKPDVVILDVAMPLLSGPDVLAALKADRETSTIPVIACTAIAGYSDAPGLREQGFDDVLLKPVDPITVIRAVERMCEGTKRLNRGAEL